MNDPLVIDTRMHGREKLAASFLVTGERTALIETGPKSSIENVVRALEQQGVRELDFIIVTHIHLDHAGGAGTLARRFPGARVVVHPVGAPHLVDPSKLWNSAARIYGDQMDELWGGIDPIDETQIDVVHDGDKIDLGGRVVEVLETPGHAWHHHAYFDHGSRSVFTGDALGVALPGIDAVRPTTPPPEFDLDKALESMDRIGRVGAEGLFLTHYGRPEAQGSAAVEAFCARAAQTLREWTDWVRTARTRTQDLDEATRLVEQEAGSASEGAVGPGSIAQLEMTSSYRMNTWGIMRYLDKREA